MGSFNTTCMVSLQTIVPGASVVLLPITQSMTYSPVDVSYGDLDKYSLYGVSESTCYSNAFWQYVGTSFTGKYDDYGCFNLFDTTENQNNLIHFFNFLSARSCITQQGENEYHDLGFDISKEYSTNIKYTFDQLISIWNYIWTAIAKNRVFVTNGRRPPALLQFAVMHQQASDYLIKLACGHKYGKEASMAHIRTTFEGYIKDKLLDRMTGFDEDSITKACQSASYSIPSLSNYPFWSNQGYNYMALYTNVISKTIDLLAKFATPPEPGVEIDPRNYENLTSDLFAIFRTHLELIYLEHGLDSLNIKLSPMVYSSQDYENDLGKGFTRMVKTVSAAINKEIKEYNDGF